MTSTTDVIKQHALKITDQRGVTLQTTWISNNTAVRTSYRPRSDILTNALKHSFILSVTAKSFYKTSRYDKTFGKTVPGVKFVVHSNLQILPASLQGNIQWVTFSMCRSPSRVRYCCPRCHYSSPIYHMVWWRHIRDLSPPLHFQIWECWKRFTQETESFLGCFTRAHTPHLFTIIFTYKFCVRNTVREALKLDEVLFLIVWGIKCPQYDTTSPGI